MEFYSTLIQSPGVKTCNGTIEPFSYVRWWSYIDAWCIDILQSATQHLVGTRSLGFNRNLDEMFERNPPALLIFFRSTTSVCATRPVLRKSPILTRFDKFLCKQVFYSQHKETCWNCCLVSSHIRSRCTRGRIGLKKKKPTWNIPLRLCFNGLPLDMPEKCL